MFHNCADKCLLKLTTDNSNWQLPVLTHNWQFQLTIPGSNGVLQKQISFVVEILLFPVFLKFACSFLKKNHIIIECMSYIVCKISKETSNQCMLLILTQNCCGNWEEHLQWQIHLEVRICMQNTDENEVGWIAEIIISIEYFVNAMSFF